MRKAGNRLAVLGLFLVLWGLVGCAHREKEVVLPVEVPTAFEEEGGTRPLCNLI